ncbi:hypothetical protein PR048_007214 [Dryococelus australis]|uniref:Uncharacterized protein n=1 Tax=Dryococelus australis TaxID=614101 RepID=A0ABQ9ICZ0_9NEOP|nr:hypothetical protein PR048_007214 [Dryococelus australis]
MQEKEDEMPCYMVSCKSGALANEQLTEARLYKRSRTHSLIGSGLDLVSDWLLRAVKGSLLAGSPDGELVARLGLADIYHGRDMGEQARDCVLEKVERGGGADQEGDRRRWWDDKEGKASEKPVEPQTVISPSRTSHAYPGAYPRGLYRPARHVAQVVVRPSALPAPPQTLRLVCSYRLFTVNYIRPVAFRKLRMRNRRSYRKLQQNGVTVEQRCGTLFANQRLVIFSLASSPTNREPFAARSSPSDTRPVHRANHKTGLENFPDPTRMPRVDGRCCNHNSATDVTRRARRDDKNSRVTSGRDSTHTHAQPSHTGAGIDHVVVSPLEEHRCPFSSPLRSHPGPATSSNVRHVTPVHCSRAALTPPVDLGVGLPYTCQSKRAHVLVQAIHDSTSRLDSTVMCILEPQMFVHWLLLQRVALCYFTPGSMSLATCFLASLLLAQNSSRIKAPAYMGAAVVERLDYPPRPHQGEPDSISGAGSLPDFRMWESCRTIPLVGGFSRGSPVSSALSFQCCAILTSILLILARSTLGGGGIGLVV